MDRDESQTYLDLLSQRIYKRIFTVLQKKEDDKEYFRKNLRHREKCWQKNPLYAGKD